MQAHRLAAFVLATGIQPSEAKNLTQTEYREIVKELGKARR
jgi:hypothetical protein